MQTNLTISAPDAPSSKTSGSNRYPPQSEATPTDQRFAELLQRRRDAQPPAKAQPAPQPTPQPEPKPESKTEGRAKPIARAREHDETHRSGVGERAARGEDKPADDATLPAATGCAASESRATSKTPTRPTGTPRDLPSVDSSFWPGMPAATAEAATAAHDASAAGGNGTLDLRIALGGGMGGGTGAGTAATGTPGTLAAGPTLAGGAASNAGRHGAGGQGGGDQSGNAATDPGAALFAAAASNAEAVATASAAGDRFTLPHRAPATDVTLPGWYGGITPNRMEGSAAAPIALPTPLASPDFAKALGAQVSLFARNGLAQAELQLTPAEMGPIRIQIAIDGVHARVDFAADSAATRQVIERGLPELASALREQGLTLSGGGVFQRAPDQPGDGDASQKNQAIGRARRRATTAVPDAVVQPPRAGTSIAQPGGVDLYA